MSDRGKLAAGVGALALFVALLVWLSEGDEPASSAAGPRTDPPTHERPRGEEPRASSVSRDDPGTPIAAAPRAPGPTTPASTEARDATGEPLSAGPAVPISLPERPGDALDNTPSPQQREASLDSVLERLNEEIAAARAAGDTDALARLEVRKARLERKRDEASASSP